MNNGNQPSLNQNQEQPKKFWQRLKLWHILITVFIGIVIVYGILIIQSLHVRYVNETKNSGSNGLTVDDVFNTYLSAEERCDINLANSVITEKSKEIIHYTCSNMADERKCLANRTYKVLTKGDTAIIHFDDFSHKTGWPFFFAKENGEWKIDFYKMANGITMGGSGCDTGWGWRNEEIKKEFCSYFKEGECPEKTVTGTTKAEEISNITNKTDYQLDEDVKLVIDNKEAIRIYTVSVEKFQNNEWKIIRGDVRCSCGMLCERAIQTLSAGANREFMWDQKETMCKKSGEGKYRFEVDWGPEGIDLYAPKISYSNEFKIVNASSFQNSDLDSKSCEELKNLRTQEYNKLDNCKTDADCVGTNQFSLGDCLNKNAETDSYRAIRQMENTKNCPSPLQLPEGYLIGCVCINNKCEPNFGFIDPIW